MPLSLQEVQLWDAYLADFPDTGQPQGWQFLDEAYPQQLVIAVQCLSSPISLDEVEEGLARLHNGRAKGPQGFGSEFLRYA